MKKIVALGLGLALSLALPACAQNLKIGTEAAYKPFAYVLPSGELTGFDIDIAKALCKQMGADVRDRQPVVRRADPGAERQEDRRDHRLDVHHAGAARRRSTSPGPTTACRRSSSRRRIPGSRSPRTGSSARTWACSAASTMANYVKATYPGARVQFYDTLGRGEPRSRRAGGSTSSSPNSVPLQEFLASPDGAGFAAVGEPVYDAGDPRLRRRHRAPEGRRGAEAEVRRRAGRDHRLGRVQDDQRQVHAGRHRAEVARAGGGAAGCRT